MCHHTCLLRGSGDPNSGLLALAESPLCAEPAPSPGLWVFTRLVSLGFRVQEFLMCFCYQCLAWHLPALSMRSHTLPGAFCFHSVQTLIPTQPGSHFAFVVYLFSIRISILGCNSWRRTCFLMFTSYNQPVPIQTVGIYKVISICSLDGWIPMR